MHMTKLFDWPSEEIWPEREAVLYSGQAKGPSGFRSVLVIVGSNQIKGAAVNCDFGRQSTSPFLRKSHLPLWMKIPLT